MRTYLFPTLMQYEPELFPGLIYRMKQPKIVLLIFVSGKIVLTGAKVIGLFPDLSACYYFDVINGLTFVLWLV